MIKAIWLDMDGTIADLYAVNGWLEDLNAERVRPYTEAKGLINLQSLARLLNNANRKGYEINIVSWTAKNGNAKYNAEVAKAKIKWLRKHLASVNFTHIDIIPYGTPKGNGREGILFDDEYANRLEWCNRRANLAYNATELVSILKYINN